jgi:hypothetical protein
MANNKNHYKKNDNKGNRGRQANVGGSLSKSEKSKVKGGVFVYNGEIGLTELSEKINIPSTNS